MMWLSRTIAKINATLQFLDIYIILKEIIMIIQTYHKDTLDITQIVNRHIQIRSHIVF